MSTTNPSIKNLASPKMDFLALMDAFDDAIIGVSLDHTILTWNRGAERIYGYNTEEVLGKSLLLIVPPHRHKELVEFLDRIRRGERIDRYETERLTKEGRQVNISLTVWPARDRKRNIVGAITIARDITEQRLAEQALQESERRALLLTEAMPQIMWTARPDGHIDYYNQQWHDYTGTTRQQQPSWEAILHPEDMATWAKRWSEALRKGSSCEMEFRLKRADGAYRWHLGRVRPIRDEQGSLVQWVCTCTDIDDLKRAEQQLQLLQQTALDILLNRTGSQVLRNIAEAARALARARYAALGVVRPDKQELMEFVTVGLTPEEEEAIGPRPKGAGVLGLLLERTEPLRIEDLSQHPRSVGFPRNHPRMKSFLGVPILRGNTVLGSLYLTDKEGGGPFTQEDEVAVQTLGAYAAVAIQSLHLQARHRALVNRLIVAQEEERRAIAYDLHDGLTQFIMASHAHLEAFRYAHQVGNSEKAQRELEHGQRYLKEAVTESRRLVNGLRALALDDLGLVGALEQLLAEERARAGWKEAEFLHTISGHRYVDILETTVYRVAQEALTNVRKHAQAEKVRLTLFLQGLEGSSPSQLVLEVKDWGKGFVPSQQTGGYNEHIGLHGMSERVSLLGGHFSLESAPGEGTLIRAIFPVLELQSKKEDTLNFGSKRGET